MAEERHDVARHTTRAASYKDDTSAEEWIESENMRQAVGYKGHDRKLGQRAA